MSDEDLETLSPHGRYLYHCARHELAFQRSASGRALFYPRLVDPETTAQPPRWDISAGKGRVYSVTLVHQRNEDPYALAMIDLDEGFRMMSRVDADNPQDVTIGAAVKVGFRRLAEDQPELPVFTLEADPS